MKVEHFHWLSDSFHLILQEKCLKKIFDTFIISVLGEKEKFMEAYRLFVEHCK